MKMIRSVSPALRSILHCKITTPESFILLQNKNGIRALSTNNINDEIQIKNVEFIPKYSKSTPTTPSTISSRPNVYGRIKKLLVDENYTIDRDVSVEHLEAIRRAKESYKNDARVAALNNGIVHDDANTNTNAVEGGFANKKSFKAFVERLKNDGGDKIIFFRKNFIHVEYTRFIALCDQVKGLTLDQALQQIQWNQKPITKKKCLKL